MDELLFEYYPEGREGDCLIAPDFQSAFEEIKWRLEDGGSRWAGIIVRGEGIFGSFRVVRLDQASDCDKRFGIVVSVADDSDDDEAFADHLVAALSEGAKAAA